MFALDKLHDVSRQAILLANDSGILVKAERLVVHHRAEDKKEQTTRKHFEEPKCCEEQTDHETL